MPTVGPSILRQHQRRLSEMHTERLAWEPLWKDIANFFLPTRYRWLLSSKEFTAQKARRQHIINSTATMAGRVLVAGLINGITSPSRPWFKLRVAGLDLRQHRELAVWLEEVERRLLQIMAESNFYNAMATLYIDMVFFNSACLIIYEDFQSVIRCYNSPLGEFCFGQSFRGDIDRMSRKFTMKAYQIKQRWPDPNYLSDMVKNATSNKNESSAKAEMKDISVCHYIGPNDQGLVSSRFDYYEMYWEEKRNSEKGIVLELRGFNEKPGVWARWETNGTDPYGTGPGADCLGDVIELQHNRRNKAELLEKVNTPPMMLDVMLQNSPIGMAPRGKTFVAGLNAGTVGAKPLYQPQVDFQQLETDQMAIEKRIRDTFYNYLFSGITDLDTVRSAEEIKARNEERLILLGGVLERFENEALDPAIERIFSIASRAGLLPPLPEEYADVKIDIQYVSILSIAQRAVGTAPTERILSFLGNLTAVAPQVMDLPDLDAMIRNYARDIGVRESEMRPEDEVQQEREQRAQAEQAQGEAELATQGAQAAKLLSETEVGGGANVLQELTGN